MLVNIPCSQGKFQITDQKILQVVAPFKKTLWQVACTDVTGMTTYPGAMYSVDVVVSVGQATYKAELVTKANYEKIKAYFPQIQTDIVLDNLWYHDKTKWLHVETYTNERAMQRDIESASASGWTIQAQSGMGGHVQVGPTMIAAALTGGWSLLLGASRTKDKITLTYMRLNS